MFSWTNSKLVLKESPTHGKGNFTAHPIKKGELLIVFGGYIMSRSEESQLPPEMNDNGVFITPDLVIGVKKISELEQASFVNHNCDPNAGFKGQISLVAMRDIAAGEEVTFDYAMVLHRSSGHPPYKFKCECGASTCRMFVTDEDWKLPELRKQYASFFQYYLGELINSGAED